MRKIPAILILLLLFVPLEKAEAAPNVQIISENDHGNIVLNPYYHRVWHGHDTMTMDIKSFSVYKTYIASYSDDFQNMGTEKTRTTPSPSQYYVKMNFTCNSAYLVEYYGNQGQLVYEAKIIVSGLENPLCDSTPDEEDIEDGEDSKCGVCACLEGVKDAINGSNDKLDQIIDKIPPPPNWQEVANTMRDTIVPKLVDDTRDMLDDLLGRAPAPPPPPPQPQAPPDVDTPNTDAMPDAPSVDLPPESNDNNFDASDVMEDAPVINYEEPDEADQGFNLTIDPLKNLENPGSPGTPVEQDDPGSPGVPKQDYDAPPKPNTPEYNPGSPGTPNQDIGTPGTPNDGDLSPANPGDDIGNPPGYYNPY